MILAQPRPINLVSSYFAITTGPTNEARARARATSRCTSPSVYSGGFGKNKRKQRPEGWITSVECLRAPSGWCSRLGAEPAVEAPAAVDPTVPGTTASAAAAGPAPVRPGYVTTTVDTSWTRSR